MLPDLIVPGLKIVFCGSADPYRSKIKSYYQHPKNTFYKTLSSCGFTPTLLNPSDHSSLLSYGIGLISIPRPENHNPQGNENNLISFTTKVESVSPLILCFNGKEPARVFFKLKYTKDIRYGKQQITIGSTKLFVAHSTAFNAIRIFDEFVWKELKIYADSMSV
jgi:TDG/mug DNA glycosylase family protein